MANDGQLSKKERAQLKKEKKAQERAAQVNAAKRAQALKWVGGIVVAIGVIGLLVWMNGDNATTNDGNEWVKGGAEAPVTLIEYSDFQCPACGSYYPLVKQLNEEFGDNLKIVYRHYPLTSIHPYAEPAAAAAEAAGRQGTFWEMHDLLFDNQRSWSSATLTQVNESFEGYAQELNLDMEQFRADINSGEVADAIRADRMAGNRDGARGTPTFILQGEKIDNPGGYDAFASLIRDALATAETNTSAEASTEEDSATTSQAVHEHADLAVYIRGQQLDLSQDKYQSHEPDVASGDHEEGATDEHLHDYLHLHDGNGAIVHKHMTGYTLADFFASLDITLTNECLTLDTGEEHCANELETLTGMVNGERVADIAGYEFNDEDRILISFGNERALDEEMASVADEACIYSETCPERGEAPTENCVGGLGTDCAE